MRTQVLAAIIFSFGLTSLASAETISVDSRISAVTVYSDRAQVTRTAKVDLKPGQKEIIFEGLPGTLEPQSISASGSGEAKVKLYGAAVKTEQLAETQSEARKKLEFELIRLGDERKLSENAKEVLDQKRQFLESIRAAKLDQIGKDLITKSPAVEEVKSIADYLENELAAYYQKAADNEMKLRDLDKEISRVQRELSKLGGGWEGVKQKTRIAVDLDAESTGTFEIEIRYRVSGASWLPFYEARAHANEGKVFWQQYANIQQNTGEDWNDVAVQLSTAAPSLSGQMPETNPWYVSKIEPRPREREMLQESRFVNQTMALKKEKSADMAGMTDEMDAPAAAPVLQANYAVASVQASGASVEYQLPKHETIASNSQPVKVSVQALDLPAGFRYQISPRLANHAYLTAKVTNPTEGILLSGEVHLFQEDTFIGTSAIDLIGPQETFDLNLGVDERIKVEHRMLKSKTNISAFPGMNGKWKTVDYAYLTKIQNYHPETIEVTVVDQVPVSQHTDIKVEKIESDPKWSEEEKEKPGVYKWHFKMPSQSKKELKLSYQVKYPESFQIDGI